MTGNFSSSPKITNKYFQSFSLLAEYFRKYNTRWVKDVDMTGINIGGRHLSESQSWWMPAGVLYHASSGWRRSGNRSWGYYWMEWGEDQDEYRKDLSLTGSRLQDELGRSSTDFVGFNSIVKIGRGRQDGIDVAYLFWTILLNRNFENYKPIKQQRKNDIPECWQPH